MLRGKFSGASGSSREKRSAPDCTPSATYCATGLLAASASFAIDTTTVAAQLTQANAPHAIDAYQAVSAQHQFSMQNMSSSRQILFRSNFGLVRFERRAGVLTAIHEMYTAAPAPEATGTDALKPELFVLHEAALEAPQAARPESLPLQPRAQAPA